MSERTCSACNGSGYYDADGSPPCDACAGRGSVFGCDDRDATIATLRADLARALADAARAREAVAAEQQAATRAVWAVENSYREQIADLARVTAERDESRRERDEYARGCRNANERLKRVLATKSGGSDV